tara:strand:- start:258 stop:491 length:234 start_codon:yes stop_codon:yes gene_type:complete
MERRLQAIHISGAGVKHVSGWDQVVTAREDNDKSDGEDTKEDVSEEGEDKDMPEVIEYLARRLLVTVGSAEVTRLKK